MEIPYFISNNPGDFPERTGGWVGNGSCTASSITAGGYDGKTMRTAKAINFTPLDKLRVKVNLSSNDDRLHGYFRIVATPGGSAAKAISLRNGNSAFDGDLDVSDLTGSYYMEIGGSYNGPWTEYTALYTAIGIIHNNAPTISGTPASGSNLGTKTAGFNVTYTVNDSEGDTVTVKEYLDNVLQRSYTATRGATNTIQCVTAANFQTVLNGAHTLKVVANDGKVDSAAYTVTFTKKVTKATITLTNPLNANAAIQVMVLAITGSLPADAKLTVLVTNNAKDSSPVWEDATADVKRGSNYIFTNKTAANGHWYNFKITVERGASDTGGNISGIGGAFE